MGLAVVGAAKKRLQMYLQNAVPRSLIEVKFCGFAGVFYQNVLMNHVAT